MKIVVMKMTDAALMGVDSYAWIRSFLYIYFVMRME